jgi:hypothetical protein
MSLEAEQWVSRFEWHSHSLHGYVKSLEAISDLIKDYSLSTATKFFVHSGKNFGDFDPYTSIGKHIFQYCSHIFQMKV